MKKERTNFLTEYSKTAYEHLVVASGKKPGICMQLAEVQGFSPRRGEKPLRGGLLIAVDLDSEVLPPELLEVFEWLLEYCHPPRGG